MSAAATTAALAGLEDLLFALEERFWTEGPDFYTRHLAGAALMILPGPAGVLVGDDIVRSLGKQPRWSHVTLEEHRALQLDERSAMLSYRATARRKAGDEVYIARASSAYVHDGRRWRLAFHQQTLL